MSAPRNRRHIFVPEPPATEPYTPHSPRIDARDIDRPQDRRAHAEVLTASYEGIRAATEEDRSAATIEVHGAKPGLYVQFESRPGVELKLEPLENRTKGIEVVAVRSGASTDGETAVQLATVFVPDGAVTHFLARFEEYANQTTKSGKPKHRELVDRIGALRRATLRALWTDENTEFPPPDSICWWEVWVRRQDNRELERLMEFAALAKLTVGPRRLVFEDRIVVLVRGTARQLSESIIVLGDIAELRLAKETAAFFVDSPPEEQAQWVDDLAGRIELAKERSSAVCILDTGVNRGHPLLERLIDSDDATAVDASWGSQDDGGGPNQAGHGTGMAGLAAYGDLVPVLASTASVRVGHRIESVKILPPRGANDPDLYGAVTAQAVSRPEITAPERRRLFSLAVTSDNRDRGQPTSWSAAVDALAAGLMIDPAAGGPVPIDIDPNRGRRLFVISAGNVHPARFQQAHLDRNDVEVVHDPAQAWNALTVGAYTEKAVIRNPQWADWNPVSRPGDLSPWSTTSVGVVTGWPIKPDVVAEGGNVAHSDGLFEHLVPDLCLLTTHHLPARRAFELSYATSAATGQVARIGAIVLSEYPNYWPETVRGLIAHAARWTPAMRSHLAGTNRKTDRVKRLLRRFGYGVPTLERVLRSANDSLTLVAQASLRPFSEGKIREMALHSLPWPKEVLQSLGPTEVTLRVTLSYFVEPNPGRRGWKRRHRYASHGLRFGVKKATETVDDFRKRLNAKALAEEEDRPGGGDIDWFIGEARNAGSLHSDTWVGTAADLADMGQIGVYPVSGWWKDLPKRDRGVHGARYSLIVSLETNAEDVDIWTPVATEVGVPVEVITGPG